VNAGVEREREEGERGEGGVLYTFPLVPNLEAAGRAPARHPFEDVVKGRLPIPVMVRSGTGKRGIFFHYSVLCV
jgi:hypothetical protein